MKFAFRTQGTCSQQILFELNDGIVSNVSFIGGCNGNLKGISQLIDGMKATDIIAKLKGTKCGFKNTSCPDQLALALEKALKKCEEEENK